MMRYRANKTLWTLGNKGLRLLSVGGLVIGVLAVGRPCPGAWKLERRSAAADPLTVTLTATKHAYHNALVTVVLPTDRLDANIQSASWLYLVADKGSAALPCQVHKDGTQTTLTFLLSDLPQGETRVFHIQDRTDGSHTLKGYCTVKPKGDDLEIFIGSRLFTRYTTKSGPNKPFFYPILTPDGQHFTRRWKVEPNAVPGESHDHPHHRGLWFTHSSVNGIDFWTEQGNGPIGKTINTGFENITSGPVYGGFRTHTEWRTPDDKQIATDTRNVRVFELPNEDRLLDFEITLTPVGGPLVLGDNKDGTFGLRLPDAFAPKPDKSATIPGEGHLLSSTGKRDKEAWGQPAEWVDYIGPIGGKTYGVALFDNPQNLRHPETWHARDYGLFAVNPFGLHDFGHGPKGAGDVTIPADKTLTLRYRVLFHKGDTAAAAVADQYAAYADPPTVTVR